MAQSFRKLLVWEKAMDLVVFIYDISRTFPKEECYGLMSQMRRCAVSIPSNIAEGRYRGSEKEFVQFLRIAYASGAELETQLEIARRLSYGNLSGVDAAEEMLEEVMKMLNTLIEKIVRAKANS